MRAETDAVPAAAERSPFLQLRVGEAPFVEPPDGPFGGCLKSRRAGQARAVNVGQVKRIFHHLGVLERLILDAVDGMKVDLLLRAEPGSQHKGTYEIPHVVARLS